MFEITYYVCVCVVQGRSGLPGSQTGRSFPRRSFARPSWMDEETVDSADASESLFFSKVSSHFLDFPLFSPCFNFIWNDLYLLNNVDYNRNSNLLS